MGKDVTLDTVWNDMSLHTIYPYEISLQREWFVNIKLSFEGFLGFNLDHRMFVILLNLDNMKHTEAHENQYIDTISSYYTPPLPQTKIKAYLQ